MEPVSPPEYIPPGHLYSPIAAKEDIERALSQQPGSAGIPGMELSPTRAAPTRGRRNKRQNNLQRTLKLNSIPTIAGSNVTDLLVALVN
jgi:hypothetical protein